MPVLNKYEMIFVHIPKTGGTTILASMPNSGGCFFGKKGDVETGHFTAEELRVRISPHVFREYWKFAVVRNPYDRMVSEYHYKKWGDNRLVPGDLPTFGDFVKAIHKLYPTIGENKQYLRCHYTPQHEFVHDRDGRLMVDKIFRFEKYDEVKQFLRETVGEEPGHSLKTERGPWQGYYDDELKSLVYDMYAEDFMIFGYER